MESQRRILVALSGGVDSAVAAGLLVEAGEDIVTVFMRNGVAGSAAHRSCCSLSDARDARAVADRLGAPFYVQDMSAGFDRLIERFAQDYAAGLTPNPCMVCNNELKFGELMQVADDLGCQGVATGHYARAEEGALRRGCDPAKDQSYVLAGLSSDQLSRARFPLGNMLKSEVRAHAARLGLGVADKPDSADICFVPGGDYRAVVADRLGHAGKAGTLRDRDGTELARHDGVAAFTVGQRRGLGVALGEPAYVTSIDPDQGTVRLGRRSDLGRKVCFVGGLSWLARPSDGETLEVQLRHHHEPERASLRFDAAGGVSLHFEQPSESVCPGQYAVFYAGDQVLGSGRILRD